MAWKVTLYVVIALCALSACGRSPRKIPAPIFEAGPYTPIEESETVGQEVTSRDFPKITMAVDGLRLVEFHRRICDMSGMSIINEISLDDRLVSCQVVDQPVDQVLSAVARRLGAQVVNSGKFFYVGSLRPEDRGTLVVKVSRLSREEVVQVVGLAMSDVGKVWSSNDGLLAVSDRVEVLGRIAEVVERVEAAQPGTWVVQIYAVALSEQRARELGVDVSQTAGIAANLAGSSLTENPTLNVNYAWNFNALVIATSTGADSRVVARPMFLIQDGASAKLQDGEVVPIPKKSVSNEGTVTVTGYDRQETGIIIEAKIRQIAKDRALLDLKFNLSQISGFVGEAPITQESLFTTQAAVGRSGVYLLGELKRDTTGANRTGLLFPTRFRWEARESVIQIWSRVFQVR